MAILLLSQPLLLELAYLEHNRPKQHLQQVACSDSSLQHSKLELVVCSEPKHLHPQVYSGSQQHLLALLEEVYSVLNNHNQQHKVVYLAKTLELKVAISSIKHL